MAKPKLAFYWCSSCGGCEESVIDIGPRLIQIAEVADIVFWPAAIDTKYSDLQLFEDGSIAACFINGSIRMDEHEQMVRLLRKKARLVIAHGACAHIGGVYGLGNFYSTEDLLSYSYEHCPTLEHSSNAAFPSLSENSDTSMGLSRLLPMVSALDQVVPVDYYIPGCPPVPDWVFRAINAVLGTEPFPDNRIFAEKKALCDSCPRRENKPDKIKLTRFKRPHESQLDPETCFLAQGILCLGPVTRGGCGSRCISANMPCRGCFGPLDNVFDQGMKGLSFLATLINDLTPDNIDEIISSIPDLGGILYRYSLPTSILRGHVKARKK